MSVFNFLVTLALICAPKVYAQTESGTHSAVMDDEVLSDGTIATPTQQPVPQPTPPPAQPAVKKAPAPQPAQKIETEKSEHSRYGFQFSGGFPTGLGFGLNYLSPAATWGLGAEYSTFSAKTSSAPEVKGNLTQMKLAARYHPWSGVFYAGVYAGTQTTRLEATDTYAGQSITAKLELKNSFVTPHIGWQWLSDFGIMYSFELGAQMNSNATLDFPDPTTNTLVTSDATYISDKKKIEDEAKKFGSSTFPHVMLFRLGYMF